MNISKQNILESIKGSNGVISTIADKLDIDWHTAKTKIEKDDDLKLALQDENERIIDKAENKLYEAIEKNDMQMVRYILSTKGKKRGYTEKQELEHTGKDGEKLTAILTVIPPEQQKNKSM